MKNNDKWKVDRAKKILELLHTGIESEDKELRDFNIIDYYRIINISPSKLYESTASELKKEFGETEVKRFRLFVLKSLNDTKLTVKAIMEVKHSVIVNDELREVTDSEKNNVIGYLKSNKLPLTANVYALALRAYLDGTLEMSNNKKNRTTIK